MRRTALAKRYVCASAFLGPVASACEAVVDKIKSDSCKIAVKCVVYNESSHGEVRDIENGDANLDGAVFNTQQRRIHCK